MQYTTFPKHDKKVSRIGFGSMGFADWSFKDGLTEREMMDSLLFALERGITFIDTARGYGQSETIIGKTLKEWKNDAPFIATKVNSEGPLSQWGIPTSVEKAFPRGHITRATEKSLTELGVEQIDLMQLHLYWPNWGLDGYWLDELNALKTSGKVKLIGVSIPDQRHETALPLIMSGHIDSIQTVFNIFDPHPLDCVIPIAAENQVGVIARCVLDESGLAGAITPDVQFAENDYRKDYFENVPREMYMERIDRLRKYIPQYARTLAALALKFVLKDERMTTAISSMHIQRFCEENIAAAEEAPLPDDIFEELRKHHRWTRNFFETKFW